MYTIRDGRLFVTIEKLGGETAVIDDEIGLLFDRSCGTILKHGSLRFVRNTMTLLSLRFRSRTETAFAADDLELVTKRLDEITPEWLAAFNDLIRRSPMVAQIRALFGDADRPQAA